MHRDCLAGVFAILAAFHAEAKPPVGVREYPGMCDASAAVAIGNDLFLAAGDEDNALRLYRLEGEAACLDEFQLDAFLGVTKKQSEVDLEGAARIGDLAFWIGSHGNSKDGEPRPNRRRFFATRIASEGERVRVEAIGRPCRTLLDVISADPRLADCRWSELGGLAPERPGAVNIEGLAATPDATLWIAFRNPVPRGKALLVELLNPREAIAGETPRLGRIARLDLGGDGVRSLEYWPAQKCFLAVSGPFDDDGPFRFWRWSGAETEPPEPLRVAAVESHKPEAAVFFAARPRDVWLLSDDGSLELNGEPCKAAPKNQRRFRALWTQLPYPSSHRDDECDGRTRIASKAC